MEDLEKIYQFFDGKIDRLGLTSSDLRIIAINNKNNTELVNKTLSTYKSYKEKLIKLNEILNKKNEMLKEEYKVNVLRNIPMSTEMAIALGTLLPTFDNEIKIKSPFYNFILFEMYNDLVDSKDTGFEQNIRSFIHDYGKGLGLPLSEVLWHKNKYDSEENIRKDMKNGSIKFTIDDLIKYGLDGLEKPLLYKYGELISYEDVKNRLISINKPDLAKRTIWASRDAGDGLGYDLLSFLDYINEYMLEVKTTKEYDKEDSRKWNGTADDYFSMSNNELDIMIQCINAYNVMRVFTNSQMAQNNEDKILYLRLLREDLTNNYAELCGIDFNGYERKYIHNNKFDEKEKRIFEFKK